MTSLVHYFILRQCKHWGPLHLITVNRGRGGRLGSWERKNSSAFSVFSKHAFWCPCQTDKGYLVHLCRVMGGQRPVIAWWVMCSVTVFSSYLCVFCPVYWREKMQSEREERENNVVLVIQSYNEQNLQNTVNFQYVGNHPWNYRLHSSYRKRCTQIRAEDIRVYFPLEENRIFSDRL